MTNIQIEVLLDSMKMKVNAQKQILVEYLQLKVSQQDWHGVADAAMDIRDLEAEEKGMSEGIVHAERIHKSG